MRYEVHLQRSIEALSSSELYNSNPELAKSMLSQLHCWLDAFANKKGEGYDYTGWVMRHREQRHHREGVREAVKVLTGTYGTKYSEMIKQEAERHILDDLGVILENKESFH